jgi:hypothetical protein
VVESVDLVLAALGAGAVEGAKNTASKVVVDAYDGLKSAVRSVLHRTGKFDPGADEALDAQLAEPERHREVLATALTEAEVDRDAELLNAARKLLTLIRAHQHGIDVHDNTGVQVGDGNTMSIDLRSM